MRGIRVALSEWFQLGHQEHAIKPLRSVADRRVEDRGTSVCSAYAGFELVPIGGTQVRFELYEVGLSGLCAPCNGGPVAGEGERLDCRRISQGNQIPNDAGGAVSQHFADYKEAVGPTACDCGRYLAGAPSGVDCKIPKQ